MQNESIPPEWLRTCGPPLTDDEIRKATLKTLRELPEDPLPPMSWEEAIALSERHTEGATHAPK